MSLVSVLSSAPETDNQPKTVALSIPAGKAALVVTLATDALTVSAVSRSPSVKVPEAVSAASDSVKDWAALSPASTVMVGAWLEPVIVMVTVFGVLTVPSLTL